MMSDQHVHVIAGVDTHGQTHHAAVIDSLGRHLADREFPATGSGYRQLLSWLGGHGTVQAVGVEGTGAYGAELSRVLVRAGLPVVEVDRPDRGSSGIGVYRVGLALHPPGLAVGSVDFDHR